MQTVKQITEDDWIAQYKPRPAPIQGSGFDFGDGCTLMEPCRAEDQAALEAADQNCVWTAVEVDGTMMIVSGAHFVNRIGYILTEVPCGDDPLEVVLDD